MANDLTTSQVADRLNVGNSTVRLWCTQGRFPNARAEETPRGPVWLIPEGDLVNFQKPEPGRPSKAKTNGTPKDPAETTAKLNRAFREAKESEEAGAKKLAKKGSKQ